MEVMSARIRTPALTRDTIKPLPLPLRSVKGVAECRDRIDRQSGNGSGSATGDDMTRMRDGHW